MEELRHNKFEKSVVNFQINDCKNITVMTNAVFTMAVVNILLGLTTLEDSVILIVILVCIKLRCFINSVDFKDCYFNVMRYCDEITNHLINVNKIKDITEITTFDIIAYAYGVKKKPFTWYSVIMYTICFVNYIIALL